VFEQLKSEQTGDRDPVAHEPALQSGTHTHTHTHTHTPVRDKLQLFCTHADGLPECLSFSFAGSVSRSVQKSEIAAVSHYQLHYSFFPIANTLK